jgi:hypothetical protein
MLSESSPSVSLFKGGLSMTKAFFNAVRRQQIYLRMMTCSGLLLTHAGI